MNTCCRRFFRALDREFRVKSDFSTLSHVIGSGHVIGSAANVGVPLTPRLSCAVGCGKCEYRYEHKVQKIMNANPCCTPVTGKPSFGTFCGNFHANLIFPPLKNQNFHFFFQPTPFRYPIYGCHYVCRLVSRHSVKNQKILRGL